MSNKFRVTHFKNGNFWDDVYESESLQVCIKHAQTHGHVISIYKIITNNIVGEFSIKVKEG